MILFLKKVASFLSFWVSFNIILIVSYHFLGRETRLGTLLDKEHRLANFSKVNKVVLIGGSNLQYSIDSKLLSEELDLPVINLGVQASLGLQYIFGSHLKFLNTDDIVILSLEPSLFNKIDLNGESTILKLLILKPSKIRSVRPRLNIIESYFTLFKDIFQDCLVITGKKIFDVKTYRQKTNEFGDYLGHKGKKSLEKNYIPLEYSELDKNTLGYFNDTILELVNRNIKVYLAWAPMPKESISDKVVKELDSLSISLNKELVSFLSAEYSLYDSNHFYDSRHHLIFDQRENRTIELLELVD